MAGNQRHLLEVYIQEKELDIDGKESISLHESFAGASINRILNREDEISLNLNYEKGGGFNGHKEGENLAVMIRDNCKEARGLKIHSSMEENYEISPFPGIKLYGKFDAVIYSHRRGRKGNITDEQLDEVNDVANME